MALLNHPTRELQQGRSGGALDGRRPRVTPVPHGSEHPATSAYRRSGPDPQAKVRSSPSLYGVQQPTSSLMGTVSEFPSPSLAQMHPTMEEMNQSNGASRCYGVFHALALFAEMPSLYIVDQKLNTLIRLNESEWYLVN